MQFWRNVILWSRTLYLFFQVALCNETRVVLYYWKSYRTRTFKPCSNPLWTIDFSRVTYIKLWWSVKDLQKNARKIYVALPLYTSDVCENICACLFSFHNTISLSRIEQVCLIRLRFERSSPIVGQRKLLCHAYLKEIRDIIIYVAWWWEKYLSKRSLIKHNSS